MLRARTAAPFPEMSVITDGGNGVQHLHRLLPGKVRSILDWFHISMRVRYLEQIVSGLRAGSETESQVKRLLAKDVSKLRWHFWHASFEKAEAKLRRIGASSRCAGSLSQRPPGFHSRLEHLDWPRPRVLRLSRKQQGHAPSITASGTVRGKPISTAMAESAVNQVINARMCKRQQMRWSPRGAHLLAHVRCAVINGDLAPRLRRWSPPLPEAGVSPCPHGSTYRLDPTVLSSPSARWVPDVGDADGVVVVERARAASLLPLAAGQVAG